jgi:hypothetical protein
MTWVVGEAPDAVVLVVGHPPSATKFAALAVPETAWLLAMMPVNTKRPPMSIVKKTTDTKANSIRTEPRSFLFLPTTRR